MKRFLSLCLVFLSLSAVQAQPVNSFLIDNFNTGFGSAVDTSLDGNGAWFGMNPGASVLGSYRVIGNYLTEVENPNLPGPYFNSTKVISSVFSISNQAETRSVGQAIWQGDAVTPNTDAIIAHPASFNLGSINLNTLLSSPDFFFQWSVINADDRNWDYTVRVYTDNAANYFEAVLSSNQSGVTLSIPKSAFVPVGSPNWANVDAVSFSTTNNDGLLGGDLAIDNVTLAVPEVSSYLMIGVTALVVGCYYYFKRSKGDLSCDAVNQLQPQGQ